VGSLPILQLGGDGEQSIASFSNVITLKPDFWHHLINSSSQGGGNSGSARVN
jgi:hypothetical protein